MDRPPDSEVRSKVRRFCLRHRIFAEPKEFPVVLVVLRAYRFHDRTIPLRPPQETRPWRVERSRIVNHHSRLDLVSAVDEFPAFHHVKILGVRRAPIVHETIRMLDEADGIDDQLAILVVADGFAEPARLRIRAVLAVEMDAAYEMVPLPEDP